MTAGPMLLGMHPHTGEKVMLFQGRFGPYLQLGDKESASAIKKTYQDRQGRQAVAGYTPRNASLKYVLAPT